MKDFTQCIARQTGSAATVTPHIYLADGSQYQLDENLGRKTPVPISATEALALAQDDHPGRLLEIIVDPEDDKRLLFLDWRDGQSAIVPQIELDGRTYVPAIQRGGLFSQLTLPKYIPSHDQLKELLTDLCLAISDFVKISSPHDLLVLSFILATWFPDLFDDVPYLALVGPPGSAKTKLLKLLSCLCRRALLVGDVRAAAVYQLVDSWQPTLLIDELEARGPKSDLGLLRLLRTGSTRGIGAVRNGRNFSTFGFKAIASRELPADAALESRFVVVPMLPTQEESKVLNYAEMRLLAEKFQPRLLMFKLTHYAAVRDFQMNSCDLSGMTPRARQLARVLAAPLEEDRSAQVDLVALLREQDDELQLERELEPEWLVAEWLFAQCHEHLPIPPWSSEILVGEIAAGVNARLEHHGERFRLSDRKVGAVLKSPLGFRTRPLGNLGRGLRMTLCFHRKVHELARQMGIDRTHITSINALEAGNGGKPCVLCDEFGLSAGLRYFDLPKPRRRSTRPRVPLFSSGDESGSLDGSVSGGPSITST